MTAATRASEQTQVTAAAHKPRVLIEEWLPAAAIGVECNRERSTGQQPPDKRLHVWWARRPLTAARAAVLASLLPADFTRDVFERLLGFGRPSAELVRIRRLMDAGVRIPGGFGVKRAFTRGLRGDDLDRAHASIRSLWGSNPTVIDPMAGGGSIPLEAARLGLKSLANEYHPVACSVLEATTDYPFRYGPELAERARRWGREWLKRVEPRLSALFPRRSDGNAYGLYLVGWFLCDAWDSADNRKAQTPKWDLEEARKQFADQALALSIDGVEVRAYVLDTRIK